MKDKYPYKTLKKKIENTEVSIVGVIHNKEFFDKHKGYFEKIISENGALVLENVDEEFWNEKDFFGRIGYIAFKQKKIIYQVDPRNDLQISMDLFLSYAGINLIIKSFRDSEKKLNRRDFLKRFVEFGIGSNIFLGSYVGSLPLRLVDKNIHSGYGIDDSILYGNFDYSNIVIAEGIEKICKTEKPKKLAAIHGASHSDPIFTYLNNPELRVKKLVYLPYDLIGEIKVKEYTPANSGWVLTKKF